MSKSAIVGSPSDISFLEEQLALDRGSTLYTKEDRDKLTKILERVRVDDGAAVLVLTPYEVKVLRRALDGEASLCQFEDLSKPGLSKRNQTLLDLLERIAPKKRKP